MHSARSPLIVVVVAWLTAAFAGSAPPGGFDAGALPAAFPAGPADAQALAGRLPPSLTVVTREGLVVAASGARGAVAEAAKHIAGLDRMLRERVFPDAGPGPIVIVVLGDDAALGDLAGALYPGVSARAIPSGGFYHPRDRLILAVSDPGDGALLRELTRAHLRDHDPEAPAWLEQALVTLFETSEVRGHRLVPVLNERMADIPKDEDLDYDVFAGICDCAPLSTEQMALMRLLLVYLDDRDRLSRLLSTIASQGRYTTLLQALDGMGFDRRGWKVFAQRAVAGHTR